MRRRMQNNSEAPPGTAKCPHTGDGRGKDLVKEADELQVGQ